MSNQCFRNDNFDSRYFALQSTEDEVAQLQESVAIRPFTQTEFAIARWDDPGTGVPIPDNAGAMLNSTVYIDNDDNLTGANSITLDPVAANPGGSDTLWLNSGDNELYKGATAISFGGDVDGPVSSTDNAIARFDGVTGKIIQNSGVTISDANDINAASGTLTLQNSEMSLNSAGNTLNCKFGNAQSQTTNCHVRSKGELSLFMEADSDGVSVQKANICVGTRRANKAYYATNIRTDNDIEHYSACDGTITQPNVLFKTGGTYAPTASGTLPTPSGSTTAMTLNGTDHKLTTHVGLKSDLIEGETATNNLTLGNLSVTADSINGKQISKVFTGDGPGFNVGSIPTISSDNTLKTDHNLTITGDDLNIPAVGAVNTNSIAATSGSTVSIEQININDDSIELTPRAAQPAAANSIWINSSDGNKLYKDAVDVETGLTISGNDNRLVRVDGTNAIQSSTVTLNDTEDFSGTRSSTYQIVGSNPVPATSGVWWVGTGNVPHLSDEYLVQATTSSKNTLRLVQFTDDHTISDGGPQYDTTAASFTFNGNSSGSFSAISMQGQRVSDFVHLSLDTLNADLGGNSSVVATTAISAAYRPNTLKIGTYCAIETGSIPSDITGTWSVTSAGIITVYRTEGGTNWAAGAGSGWQNIEIQYYLKNELFKLAQYSNF